MLNVEVFPARPSRTLVADDLAFDENRHTLRIGPKLSKTARPAFESLTLVKLQLYSSAGRSVSDSVARMIDSATIASIRSIDATWRLIVPNTAPDGLRDGQPGFRGYVRSPTL